MSAPGDPTPSEVAEWLRHIGLGDYAEGFERNHVGGGELVTLTGDDLKNLGVVSLGHRKMLLAEIRKLVEQALARSTEPPAPKSPAPEVPAAKTPPAPAPLPEKLVAAPPSLPAEQSALAARDKAAPSFDPERKVVSDLLQSPSDAVVAPKTATPESSPATKRTGFLANLLVRKFLFVSIVLHLLFGMGATYFIVQKVQAKKKVTFQGGPPTVTAGKRALEHKVSMAQKKKTGGAPPQPKRIVSAGLAKVSLPDLPSVPMATTVVPGMMAGMGGAGFGSGMGMGGGMGGGGGGGGLTMFGVRGGGTGLVGTFYDFKRDEHGKDTGIRAWNRPLYTQILKSFINSTSWTLPSNFKHFTSKSKLGAKAFFFPLMPDTQAGEAFQVPGTGPGMWLAHYTGNVTPSVSGRFRFVGWGDNVLIVAINGRVMLEATDIGYLGIRRENAGTAFGKPIFAGEWFSLNAGTTMRMDVMLGDEGGEFCAGLHLQKEGENFSTGREGIPNLPLFLCAPFGSKDKELYSKYLGEKAFNGPVFTARSGGMGSLVDVLKR